MFGTIVMVILSSWGIAQYSLLYPHSKLSLYLIRDVLLLPYWQMLGDSQKSEIIKAAPYDMPGLDDASCTDNDQLYSNYTQIRCPDTRTNQIVVIFLIFYVLITNVLLLNILIAIFNSTFTRIEGMNFLLITAYSRWYIFISAHLEASYLSGILSTDLNRMKLFGEISDGVLNLKTKSL